MERLSMGLLTASGVARGGMIRAGPRSRRLRRRLITLIFADRAWSSPAWSWSVGRCLGLVARVWPPKAGRIDPTRAFRFVCPL